MDNSNVCNNSGDSVETDPTSVEDIFGSNDSCRSSEEIYEVEKIITMRNMKGKREFKVRWLGYSKEWDTWEPEENLADCQSVIDEYINKQGDCDDVSKKLKPKKKKNYYEIVSEDEDVPIQTLKDTFWEELEAGKIDVFKSDMYSAVKKRDKRPNTLNEDELFDQCILIDDTVPNHNDQSQPCFKSAQKTANRSHKKKIKEIPCDGKSGKDDENSTEGTCNTASTMQNTANNCQKAVPQKHRKKKPTRPNLRRLQMISDNHGVAAEDDGSSNLFQSSAFDFGDENMDEAKPATKVLQENEEDASTVSLDVKLKKAIKKNDVHKLQMLLEERNRHNFDVPGQSLLILAAKAGHTEIVETLLSFGADINEYNEESRTALMCACGKGHLALVEILLQHNAYINAEQQPTHETALIKACKYGHQRIVAVLLENGANFGTIMDDGLTAIDVAEKYNKRKCAEMLIKHRDSVVSVFEKHVQEILNGTAHVVSSIMPEQCFCLKDSSSFKVEFRNRLPRLKKGQTDLLFIAQAKMDQETFACRCYGLQCAILSTHLNNTELVPVIEESRYVYAITSFERDNELCINTVTAPKSKAKLIIGAYRVELKST